MSPMLFVFATSFVICRIQTVGPVLEPFSYVDDSMIDLRPKESVLCFRSLGLWPTCGAVW